jgi:hypothetical protein
MGGSASEEFLAPADAGEEPAWRARRAARRPMWRRAGRRSTAEGSVAAGSDPVARHPDTPTIATLVDAVGRSISTQTTRPPAQVASMGMSCA